MPSHRSRRSRRLSNRPPRDTGARLSLYSLFACVGPHFNLTHLLELAHTEFQEIDDFDLRPLNASLSVHTATLHEVATPHSSPEPYDGAPEYDAGSNSRRKRQNHISRPPNPFLIFRSHHWSKEKGKPAAERDHREISKTAGDIWKSMGEEARKPYVKLFERTKELHSKVFPNYKYAPACKKKKNSSTKREPVQVDHEAISQWRYISQRIVHDIQALLNGELNIDEYFDSMIPNRTANLTPLVPTDLTSPAPAPTNITPPATDIAHARLSASTTTRRSRLPARRPRPSARTVTYEPQTHTDEDSDTSLSNPSMSSPGSPEHFLSPSTSPTGTPSMKDIHTAPNSPYTASTALHVCITFYLHLRSGCLLNAICFTVCRCRSWPGSRPVSACTRIRYRSSLLRHEV